MADKELERRLDRAVIDKLKQARAQRAAEAQTEEPKKKYNELPYTGPPMPRIDKQLVQAIEAYLIEAFEIKRPPIQTAKLLALIVQLEEKHIPFPRPRTVASRAIGGSKFGMDVALNTALARGLITQEMTTTYATENNQREGVIRHRIYKPTAKLLQGIGRFRHTRTRAA
jgi:hypothetical protein